MHIIIANKSLRKWLNQNLVKYEKEANEKYIEKVYTNPEFNITLYNTNTLIIKGKIEDRIYRKLIEVCGENNCIGMDEVGVGDFFGPTVYCSVYMNEKTMEHLKNNPVHIKDSKKMANEDILSIYEELKDNVDYESEIIYDYEINPSLNSVEQKMYYHNKNYLKYLDRQVPMKELIIDLFTTENNFKKRTSESNYIWNDNLTLETKADGKYICVALASMLARGMYLEAIKEIEAKYNVKLLLGTNENVKNIARDFIEDYSKEELAKVCKTTFKTFKEL